MKFSISSTDISDFTGSILLIGVLEESFPEYIGLLENKLNKESLKEYLAEKDFSGKTGQKYIIDLVDKGLNKLILIGLGKAKDLSLNELRKATAIGLRQSIGDTGSLGIFFPLSLIHI